MRLRTAARSEAAGGSDVGQGIPVRTGDRRPRDAGVVTPGDARLIHVAGERRRSDDREAPYWILVNSDKPRERSPLRRRGLLGGLRVCRPEAAVAGEGAVLDHLGGSAGNLPARGFALAPEPQVEHSLAEAQVGVWAHDSWYSLDLYKRLDYEQDAVRIGFIHYNTEEEVDRLLAGLAAAPDA